MLYSETSTYLDCISLLIHINDEKTKLLVSKVLENLDNTNNTNLVSNRDPIGIFYKSIVKELLNNEYTIDNSDELNILLLKYKNNPAIEKNPEIYKTIENLFNKKKDFNETNLKNTSKRLQNILIWDLCNAQVRKMFGHLNQAAETKSPIKQSDALSGILEAASNIESTFKDEVFSQGDAIIEKTVEHIDFTNKNHLLTALSTFKERKRKGAMKLGLQGLNRLFGEDGGPTLGETIVFSALPYGFKSGMLKSIAKWIVKYNIPPTHPEGKPALIIFFTLENEGFQNLIWWFKSVYETTTNSSSAGLDDDYVVEYVYNYFNQSGYHFIVQRYHPSDFGYNEFKSVCEYYSQTYNIVSTIIDYMGKMSKGKGKSSGEGNHLLYGELYSNVCNFAKQYGFLLATAHQLNREAKRLAANASNVVKKFNSIHMADSMDVEREVDTLIFLHIEENSVGDSYLTGYRYKRRHDEALTEKDKYFAYRFTPYGIPDDVEGVDMSIKDIYSDAKVNGNKSHITTVEEAF
jgi:hypothetical protein